MCCVSVHKIPSWKKELDLARHEVYKVPQLINIILFILPLVHQNGHERTFLD